MKFSWLIICCVFCLTCNKIELPLKTGESPIFEVTANLGPQPVNLIAGKNNVILDTRFFNDELNVLHLVGELKKKDCVPPCPSSLRITLRQNHREFIAHPDRIIQTGRRPYFMAPLDSFLIQSKNASILSNTSNGRYSFGWTVNDKKFTDKENISTHINPAVKNRICMYVTHPDGSNASQCQVVDFNLADSFPGLKVSIVPQNIGGKEWVLVPRINGVGPFKYNWNNKNIEATSDLDIKQPSNQCLTVTDQRGNTASACIDFNPEAKIKCQANFDVLYDQSRLKEFTQFNSVEVVYIDDQGLRFTSVAQPQPNGAFFEILEESNYEDNDLKQPTKKLKLKFDMQLFGNNRPSVSFKGTGSIAVAYPK